MKDLTFVTGNPAKAKYLAEYFDISIRQQSIDLPEIQSLDVREVVEHKARAAYQAIRKPVMVEDVSLSFGAIKGLPGSLIKWFLLSLGNEGICNLLKNYKDRSATAKIAYCIFDGKIAKVFTGSTSGSISKKPRGKTNFGWDPIFIPKGYTETWAEMGELEKDKTSMRKKALVKVKKYLKTL